MTDSDPPDEVDDCKSPADRDVYAPDPDALIEEIANGKQEPLQDQKADQHPQQPPVGDPAAQHNGADLFGDARVGVSRLNDGRLLLAGFDFCSSRHELYSR